MKNILRSMIAVAATATMVSSCNFGEFGDINVSPNSPTIPYTNMFFTNACLRVPSFVCNSNSFDIWTQCWNGYLSESKNNQYGPMQNTVEYGTAGFYTGPMKTLNFIIELNKDPETKDKTYVTKFGSNANQIAAAMTLKAFYMMSISDIVGALPYSEAWKGDEDIWKPKFDSQEEIYAQLDKELVEAYNMIDPSSSLLAANEILFGGDMAKWKKFNATLRMMMAIKMADVDPVNGKARFAKAYADGGMVNAEDSFTYTFDVKQGSTYSLYLQDYNVGGTYNNYVPNSVIVDLLKEYQDPRLFEYCSVDGYKGHVEGDPKAFETYKGVPFGLESNTAVNQAQVGCANIAKKYFLQEATYGVITAARCLLVEAEAAELGWISADPKALYEAGIRASFAFEGAEGVEEYLASEKVQLSSDKNEALKQIVTQRYLAGFMTDGIEAWSDWRRYNIPDYPIYAGQVNEGISVYPYRMQYGNGDYKQNSENYEEAVNKYLGGKDSRWSRVWWDVADNK